MLRLNRRIGHRNRVQLAGRLEGRCDVLSIVRTLRPSRRQDRQDSYSWRRGNQAADNEVSNRSRRTGRADAKDMLCTTSRTRTEEADEDDHHQGGRVASYSADTVRTGRWDLPTMVGVDCNACPCSASGPIRTSRVPVSVPIGRTYVRLLRQRRLRCSRSDEFSKDWHKQRIEMAENARSLLLANPLAEISLA